MHQSICKREFVLLREAGCVAPVPNVALIQGQQTEMCACLDWAA